MPVVVSHSGFVRSHLQCLLTLWCVMCCLLQRLFPQLSSCGGCTCASSSRTICPTSVGTRRFSAGPLSSAVGLMRTCKVGLCRFHPILRKHVLLFSLSICLRVCLLSRARKWFWHSFKHDIFKKVSFSLSDLQVKLVYTR